MKTHTMEQGTPEWLLARCGLLTASTVKQVLTAKTLKVGNNDKTRALAFELAAQRVNQYVEPQFETFAMARGHVDEVYARELYNETTNTEAYEVGFTTEEIAPGVTLGYSPDGLVGEDGLIEIKSRCQKYQMQTIAANIAPAEYMLQMQTGMLVTGRKWCDFVSYCGGMPLFIKRVYPDAEMRAAIVAATVALEDKINELIEAYTENCKGMPVAPRIDYNNEIEL